MGPLASLMLNHSNKYKIALNGMPITALDIYITLHNPDVLWQILVIPKWIGWAMLSATCLALVFVTIILIRSLRPLNIRSFAAIFVTLFMTGFAGDAFATRLQDFIKSGLSKDESKIWLEEGVAAISKKMGPIPFLIYSWRLESQSGAVFFRAGLSEKMTPETQLIVQPVVWKLY